MVYLVYITCEHYLSAFTSSCYYRLYFMRCQVLSFIDDQQAAFSLPGDIDQKRFERQQDVGLAKILGAYAERRSNHAQGVVRVELRADEMRRNHLGRIELAEQSAHDRGLAGTNLARYDNETFILMESVFEISRRPPMLLAAEVEIRVGVELKWLAAQAIVGLIHNARA